MYRREEVVEEICRRGEEGGEKGGDVGEAEEEEEVGGLTGANSRD